MIAKVHFANKQFLLVLRGWDFVDCPSLLVAERLALFPVLEPFAMSVLGDPRLVDFPVAFALLMCCHPR